MQLCLCVACHATGDCSDLAHPSCVISVGRIASIDVCLRF